MTDRASAIAQLNLHKRKLGGPVAQLHDTVAERKSIFPHDIETGEVAEDELPHLFDIWDFDKMPKFDHAVRYVKLNYIGVDADMVLNALEGGEGEAISGRCDDVLRTCRLYPAPLEDPLVREHLSHITAGKKFKPACLVMWRDGRYKADLIDGYHRVSCAWWCDAQMACPIWKIVI